jgi:hypothetical protein
MTFFLFFSLVFSLKEKRRKIVRIYIYTYDFLAFWTIQNDHLTFLLYTQAYCIMAQVADSLLMNLNLSESNDGDHRPAKTTSPIISLMENGAINDAAIISLLLSHHRQPDKVQQ